MSMIEVRGTRSKDKDASAQGRDKYEDKTDARGLSHIPFYAGAALSALVLYLKESLADPTRGHGPREEEQKHGPDKGAANERLAGGDGDLGQMPMDGGGTGQDALHPGTDKLHLGHKPVLYAVGHSGWSSHSYGSDSLDKQFQPVAQPGWGAAEVAMSFPAISSNDNHIVSGTSQAPVDTGGGGNAGGGNTGSGSGGTTPPEPKKNHAPKVSGRVKLGTYYTCTDVAILIAALLGNASDADADPLSVKDVKINGVLLTQVNGAYSYHGETVGPVIVNYRVSDGTLSVAATGEIIFVEKPPILGTDGDDILLGTECDDLIDGRDGDDRIDGNGGDDTIYGGCGNDHIVGGDGDDVIYGGGGNDIIFGGRGNDILSGDDGNDRLFGGLGNDILRGGAGHDVIYGDEGKDILIGESGNDELHDGDGEDDVDGGIGNDTVVASADAANDKYVGGADTDKLSYRSSTSNLDFDMAQHRITGADIGHDQAGQFEILEGGKGNDTFHAAVKPASAWAVDGDHGPVSMQRAPLVYLPHDDEPGVGRKGPTVYLPKDDDASDAAASGSIVQDAALNPPAEDGQHDMGADAGSSDASSDGSANQQDADAPQQNDGSAGDDEAEAGHHEDDVDAMDGYTYLGGAGSDTLDYGAARQKIIINLAAGTAQGVELGKDYFSSIESFVTGAGDDVFVAGGNEVQQRMSIAAVADHPENPDCCDDAVDDATRNAVDLSDSSGDLVSGAAANQRLSGGAGHDTLDYSDATHAVTINTDTGMATGQDIGVDLFDGIEHFIGGAGDDTFVIGSGAVVLDGNGGADVFQFVAPAAGSDAALTIAHIEGFEVGDLVRMSMYDLFDQADQGNADAFQSYANQQNGSGGNGGNSGPGGGNGGNAEPDLIVPIRVRIDTVDDHQTTYIDADLDNNGSYEITVQLDGNHHLTIINNHIA